MYMATIYSRKLKAENDCGNHASGQVWPLSYTALIVAKPLLAMYVETSAAYLTHGGELECKVTGRRWCSPLIQGGLKISCNVGSW